MKLKNITALLLVANMVLPNNSKADTVENHPDFFKLLDTIYSPIKFTGERRYGFHNLANILVDAFSSLGVAIGVPIAISNDAFLTVKKSQDLVLNDQSKTLDKAEIEQILARVSENGVQNSERIYLVGLSYKVGQHTQTTAPTYVNVGGSNNPIMMPVGGGSYTVDEHQLEVSPVKSSNVEAAIQRAERPPLASRRPTVFKSDVLIKNISKKDLNDYLLTLSDQKIPVKSIVAKQLQISTARTILGGALVIYVTGNIVNDFYQGFFEIEDHIGYKQR